VRDVLPNGRPVYRLLLTYKLSVAEPGKYKPTVPLLNK
jgi:tripeptidyl-peptidase-2